MNHVASVFQGPCKGLAELWRENTRRTDSLHPQCVLFVVYNRQAVQEGFGEVVKKETIHKNEIN